MSRSTMIVPLVSESGARADVTVQVQRNDTGPGVLVSLAASVPAWRHPSVSVADYWAAAEVWCSRRERRRPYEVVLTYRGVLHRTRSASRQAAIRRAAGGLYGAVTGVRWRPR